MILSKKERENLEFFKKDLLDAGVDPKTITVERNNRRHIELKFTYRGVNRRVTFGGSGDFRARLRTRTWIRSILRGTTPSETHSGGVHARY